ncbi:MAG: acyl-ACP--UDP-N-acetylglucosamine O-acyltransferase [Melioribacteraceae bacterium]|nr:acyl-ACP--UDP-N-acetylglucosamine O-acyltransferase [Melioribacteraceae bacterium]
MSLIHSTSIVSPNAKIGENVKIGPFSIIHDDVEIGDYTEIGSSAVLYNGARIGKNVRIYQGASIANTPQDLKFGDEKTYFFVGDNTTIREFVTLHRGTLATGKSSIGNDCLLMAYTHVAHDCIIGNNCILSNAVQIGGHVHVENWVTIGGLTAVHQFSKIGEYSMVGGAFKVTSDIPPYVMAAGEPIRYHGMNIIGLRRRGFSKEDIAVIKDCYHFIYHSGHNFSQSKEKIAEKYPDNVYAKKILDFFADVKRAVIRR